jgi:putative addiction module component (TIGR02574 family)
MLRRSKQMRVTFCWFFDQSTLLRDGCMAEQCVYWAVPHGVRIGAFPEEYIMNALIEELSVRARALPPEDRARLAEELLASLQDEPESEADAAWDIEIRRRVEQVKSGTATLVSAEAVHAQARQFYR